MKKLRRTRTVAGKVNRAAAAENRKAAPRKIKTRMSRDPAIPLLSMCPEELEAGSQRDICTSVFTAASLATAKTWGRPRCPSTDEQRSKMWCAHTVDYFPAFSFFKKRKFCDMLHHGWTSGTLSGLGQSQKDMPNDALI